MTALVVFLILGFVGIAVAQSVDSQFLIAPRIGVGSVHFGMTLEQVHDLLGKERSVRQMEPSNFEYLFPTEGKGSIRLVLDDKGIKWLGVRMDPRYQTDKGIGVGSTEAEIRSAYGSPSEILHLPDRTASYYNNPKGPPYDVAIYSSQHLRFYIERDPNNAMVNQVYSLETWRDKL